MKFVNLKIHKNIPCFIYLFIILLYPFETLCNIKFIYYIFISLLNFSLLLIHNEIHTIIQILIFHFTYSISYFQCILNHNTFTQTHTLY